MTASIWFHPEGARKAQQIDLGASVTDLEEEPDVLVTAAESLHGNLARTLFRSRLRVRIELANFADEAVERKLMSLQSHLDAGGSCAFALNNAKAWAGYTARPYAAGGTVLYTRGNVWSYLSTAQLASGDSVTVFGGSPEGWREYTTTTTTTSSTTTAIALTDALRYGYSQGPLLVRHRWYYPALRRQHDDTSPIVTSNRRITYTLDMTLVEDLALLAAAADWSPGVLASTTDTGRGQSAKQLNAQNNLGLRQSIPRAQSFSATRPAGG